MYASPEKIPIYPKKCQKISYNPNEISKNSKSRTTFEGVLRGAIIYPSVGNNFDFPQSDGCGGVLQNIGSSPGDVRRSFEHCYSYFLTVHLFSTNIMGWGRRRIWTHIQGKHNLDVPASHTHIIAPYIIIFMLVSYRCLQMSNNGKFLLPPSLSSLIHGCRFFLIDVRRLVFFCSPTDRCILWFRFKIWVHMGWDNS